MATTSNRFILSPDQINAYLIRIRHPKPSPGDASSPTKAPGLLASLQRQHLASVPFENLSIHYSVEHAITLDPEELYTKIVMRRRGGYCMENNLLFGNLLRGFGFTVYSVGGRVSNDVLNLPDGGYGGWYVTLPFLLLQQGTEISYQGTPLVVLYRFYSPNGGIIFFAGVTWSISSR